MFNYLTHSLKWAKACHNLTWLITVGLPVIMLVIVLVFSGLPFEPALAEEAASAMISAGSSHTLVLKSDGTVWAWGHNFTGELGDGTRENKYIPVQVSGLGNIIAISAGYQMSLALKNDGTVWSWGANSYGQLGDGTTENRRIPVQVIGLSDVEAISVGHLCNFALKNDGTVWSWGWNTVGQLGDGTTENRRIPVQVAGLNDVKSINAGRALKNDGTVWAWGSNFHGQLGDGTTVNRKTPVQVIGLSDVKEISARYGTSLALKNDGTVWAWGTNWDGQLGDGTTVNKHMPIKVNGLSGVKAISSGGVVSLALKNDGTVWAWGRNTSGQLGDGTEKSKYIPVQVSLLASINAISAEHYHCLALESDGTVWAWGSNVTGRLGDGTTVSRRIPVKSLINLGDSPTLDPNPNPDLDPTPDPEKPVAQINPEKLLAASGIPFNFSGAPSFHEDGIVAYEWNFGDGASASGMNVFHTYSSPGDYSVTLTVRGASGSIGSITRVINVVDLDDHSDLKLVTINIVDVQTVEKVPFAEVNIIGNDYEVISITDEDGILRLVMNEGTYQMSAIAEGYMPRMADIMIYNEDQKVRFGLSKGQIVVGELSVREMSYEEIRAAGIDADHPDNQHVYDFSVTFEFIAGPKIYNIPINIYKNGTGKIIKNLSNMGLQRFVLREGVIGEQITVNIMPISERFFLIIYGEARWLKEIFKVELLVVNHSAVDWISNCSAQIIIPEGLSFATMLGGDQSSTVKIPFIRENDEARVEWFIRGDAEGEYNLTAVVEGTYMPNPEPFSMLFQSENPFRVYAGSALHLTITAPNIAHRGKPYNVTLELENVSDKTLFDVHFAIKGIEQFQVLEYGESWDRIVGPIRRDDFNDNHSIKIPKLEPGESINTTISTNIWFTSFYEMSFIDIDYYLSKVFVTALEGSTTEIPYTIKIVSTPYSSIIDKVLKEVGKGVGNRIAVNYGSPIKKPVSLILKSKKIYEFTQGETNSKVNITLEQPDERVVSVSTTSANQIVQQGVITLDESADIIVEAIRPGQAKLIFNVEDPLLKGEDKYTRYEIPFVVESTPVDLSVSANFNSRLAGNSLINTFDKSKTDSIIAKINELEESINNLYPHIYFNSILVNRSGLDEHLRKMMTSEEFIITVDLLEKVINETKAKIKFNSHIANLNFDQKALSTIINSINKNTETIKVSIKAIDSGSLNNHQKEAAGNRPVYELRVLYDDKIIKDFRDGTIDVSIPYQLKINEYASNLKVLYLNESGYTSEIASFYNTENKSIEFSTNHFSLFVVGYDAYLSPDHRVPGPGSDSETGLRWPWHWFDWGAPSSDPSKPNDSQITDNESNAIRGDITGDGKVDIRDVTLVMQHVLGIVVLNSDQIKVADVNSDGVIDIHDVILITKYSLGLIS